MRRVLTAAFVSLDGVMQAPGGPQEDGEGGFEHGGWTFHHWDEAMRQAIGETMARPFDLLLGRKTYDIFAAHWPFAGDDPIAVKFNAATKYVATHEPSTLNWENSVALTGDIAGEIARIKAQEGHDLLIQGSSQLIQTLLKHDLIDEYGLWIFPVVLGTGKRFFGTGKRFFGAGALPGNMKLVASKVSTTGVIMTTYRRIGDVTTGSFALDEPSEEELKRRQKTAAA